MRAVEDCDRIADLEFHARPGPFLNVAAHRFNETFNILNADIGADGKHRFERFLMFAA